VKTLPEEILSDEIKAIGWTDIHTHLNFLEITPEEALAQGKRQGVNRMITIGTEPDDLPVVLALADKFAPNVFCTLGIHPHEGKVYSDQVEAFLLVNLNKPRVVAVGEIGLDYYYQNSPREEQIEAFRRQMDLAEKFDLPVEIHTRDAEDDTIEILNDYKGRVKGVIHCFTGTQRLADAALDCGYNISFSGIVTFKKAVELQEVCKNVPLDRMHVETDAPFLAPTPLRGKKNQPDFMLWTALFVSQLKAVEILPFAEQMRLNAEKLFPRLIQQQKPS
jgi:TatD DNase family protein